MHNSCNKSLYLQLETECKQIILLANKDNNGGLVYSEKGVMSFTPKAFRLIYNSFVAPGNYPIDCFIEDQADRSWLNDLLKNDLFSVTYIAPCKKILDQYQVTENESINTCYTTQPFLLQPMQNVVETYFNDVIVYYVTSLKEIPTPATLIDSASSYVANDNSTAIYPYLNINLYPSQSEVSLSATCTGCSQCTNCDYCLICLIGIALTIGAVNSHGCAGTATSCEF